ncbi:hypothetical protein [Demequina globuliformis]|uniref:hypothetical protein n=1 Tax=Demequina globuliformis TaxID=676202 RepID=UPI00078071F5|nr:hypothetical protein [Demequina globuliformis]
MTAPAASMPPASPTPPEPTASETLHGDVRAADLLPLSGPPARVIVGLFVITNTLFALGNLEHVARSWQALAAVVLISAAGLLVVRHRPSPFPLSDCFVILACLTAGNAMVFTNLLDHDDLGRATWNLGSATWALFFVAMRGRIGIAWLGMAVMLAQCTEWAIRTDRGALTGLSMLDTHIGILAVGSLFALSLRRTAQQITDLNHRTVDGASEAAAAAASAQIRRTRADELAQLVTPLLERIASGDDLSDAERGAMARAEAQLRDGVRGHAIALPSVVEATNRARERGVAVTLLDDRGSQVADGHAVARMVNAIVAALDATCTGDVTVRLHPEGRPVALTIRTSSGDDVTRVSLDERGLPRERTH